MDLMHGIRRVVHGLRKVAAGLRPFNESVWPGLRNDLFVAHESVYHFFARYAAGKAVLDAGCGTGYGSALLAQHASRVLGVDVDPRSVRYARRHFASERTGFRTIDIQHLPFEAEFDLIVSSNALEHLNEPALFIAGACRALVSEGTLIVAVPPIFTEHDEHAHSTFITTAPTCGWASGRPSWASRSASNTSCTRRAMASRRTSHRMRKAV